MNVEPLTQYGEALSWLPFTEIVHVPTIWYGLPCLPSLTNIIYKITMV